MAVISPGANSMFHAIGCKQWNGIVPQAERASRHYPDEANCTMLVRQTDDSAVLVRRLIDAGAPQVSGEPGTRQRFVGGPTVIGGSTGGVTSE